MDETTPEMQKKSVEFLKALNAETEGDELELGYYVIKLGEQLGFSTQETTQILAFLLKQGYIRNTGHDKFITISQLGKKFIESLSPPKILSGNDSSPEKYAIFISRINEHKEISKKLKELLESLFAEKIQVFDADDPNCIPFSADWFTTIKEGIQSCNLMIILCSPSSVQRPWINFEAGAATILEKSIGPICFAGQNAGNLPSPLNYIRSQAVDLTDREKFKQYFDGLLNGVAHQLKTETPNVNVLETDFFKLLDRSREGNPRKPPIVAIKGF